MAKKTLEDKIKLVCWWALVLTILYFAIGAWLKSDGPKFDPAKTYDLLKDTLTLTATFLAPVAAFVLFSDWRREHRDKHNEELVFSRLEKIDTNSNEIIIIINMVNAGLQEAEPEVNYQLSSNILSFKKEALLELGVLEMNRVFFEDETFLNEATAFYQNQIEILDSLKQLFISFENLDGCRASPTDPDDEEWALRFYVTSVSEFSQKAEDYLSNFNEHLIRLRNLAQSYKI